MRNKKRVAAVAAVVVAAIIIALAYDGGNGRNAQLQNLTIGSRAPDYGFLVANGSTVNLSAYIGHPVLLWFVTTWCPSCAQGSEAINQNYQFFRQHGIKIVELELYRDLGYSGPAITSFVGSYAPAAWSNGTVIPAYAGYNMTAEYDPSGYLDIYYLIAANGTILYISGSPSSTLGQLEAEINRAL